MAGDNLEVTRWRVRLDTLDPNTDGDWLAPLLVNPPPIPIGQRFRIRYVLTRNATLDDPVDRNIKHQQNRNSIGWNNTTTAGIMAESPFYAHRDESTEVLIGITGQILSPNTGLMEAGGVADTTGTMTFPGNESRRTVEIEICLMFNVGGVVVPGDTVAMRLRKTNNIPFGDGHVTVPVITAGNPGATQGAGFMGAAVVGSGSIGSAVAGDGFMGPTTKGAGIIRPGG